MPELKVSPRSRSIGGSEPLEIPHMKALNRQRRRGPSYRDHSVALCVHLPNEYLLTY